MKIIGLTGGIGSGKSTVAQIFQTLGIPVYNSDKRAKDLYTESPELKQEMITHFGEDVYLHGEINRAKLAALVFTDKSQIQLLNSMVHPRLQRDFELWKSKQKAPYVIREAAILVESGAHNLCDAIIAVVADQEVRIQRVMERDKVSRLQVEQRMENQISDEERMQFAQFQIRNNGTESLINQVLEIHHRLLQFK